MVVHRAGPNSSLRVIANVEIRTVAKERYQIDCVYRRIARFDTDLPRTRDTWRMADKFERDGTRLNVARCTTRVNQTDAMARKNSRNSRSFTRVTRDTPGSA